MDAEDDGIFMPESLIQTDFGVDPWLDPLFDALRTEHKAAWKAMDKRPVKERLAILAEQISVIASRSSAVQAQLLSMAEEVEKKRFKDAERNANGNNQDDVARDAIHTEIKTAMDKKTMSLNRKRGRQMRRDVLGTIEDSSEEEEEQGEDDVPIFESVISDETEERPAQSDLIDAERLLSLVSQPDAILDTVYKSYAMRAMKLFTAPGFDDGDTKCRVLFFSHSMSATDASEETLNSSFGAMVDVVEALKNVGIDEKCMAWATCVPLFHALKWDRNYPSKNILAVFAPYAKQVILALRPRYIIATSVMACDLLQRSLDMTSREAVVIDANMLISNVFVAGYKYNLMRMEHPYSISKMPDKVQARNDAIKKLCETLTPTREVKNAFDVLRGRVSLHGDSAGGLMWVLNDKLALMNFPSDEEVGRLLRYTINYVLNLTKRTPKLPRSFAGVKDKASRETMKGLALYNSVDTAIKTANGGRFACICPTGIRDCVFFAAAVRIFCMHQIEPFETTIKWALTLRHREIPQADLEELRHFFTVCGLSTKSEKDCGMYLLIIKHRKGVWIARRAFEELVLKFTEGILLRCMPPSEDPFFKTCVVPATPVNLKDEDGEDLKMLTPERWQRRLDWIANRPAKKLRSQ